uniref:Interleukin-31 receptor subunit alpha n=1 Tax=Lygus hesperus TaxID=30085 RepID=A0A0A9XBR8_LYGHE
MELKSSAQAGRDAEEDKLKEYTSWDVGGGGDLQWGHGDAGDRTVDAAAQDCEDAAGLESRNQQCGLSYSYITIENVRQKVLQPFVDCGTPIFQTTSPTPPPGSGEGDGAEV